jgi:anti-anti-sigma factor
LIAGKEWIINSYTEKSGMGVKMEIEHRKDVKADIMTVKGRMDAITTAEFDKKIEEIIQQKGNTIIVDFSGLDYISSAGLRSILSASKKLKGKGGTIILTALKDVVRDVFEISGFSSILTIHESVEKALVEI